jgi:hypothetical protein
MEEMIKVAGEIAADWKSLGSDDDFSYFYDSATISHPSKPIDKVANKSNGKPPR